MKKPLRKLTGLAVAAIVAHTIVFAQSKHVLTPEDMPAWQTLKRPAISNDGLWVSYETVPYRGDGMLHLVEVEGAGKKVFARASKAAFDPSGKFVAFLISPSYDTLKALKLKKTPKDKMPGDTLAVYFFANDSIAKIPGVKKFNISDRGSSWIAIEYSKKPEREKEPEHTKKKRKKKKKKTEKPVKKKKNRKLKTIGLFDPVSGKRMMWEEVDEYVLSDFGNSFGYTRTWGDTIDSTGVYWVSLPEGTTETVYLGVGKSVKPAFNYPGDQMVFLHSSDTGKTKVYELYFTSGNRSTRIIVNSGDRYLPDNYAPSEHYTPRFSRDGTKIYFGTAPKPEETPEDSIPDDEKPKLDIWHWQDKEPQPRQLLKRKREEKRTYLTVFHINAQKPVVLTDSLVREVRVRNHGNIRYMAGFAEDPYAVSYSWDFPWKKDVYRIDNVTGEKKLLLRGHGYPVYLSPTGHTLLYFSKGDWHSLNIESGKQTTLTAELTGKGISFVDKTSEIPAGPMPFGFVGWNEGGSRAMVRAEYDLWVLDPAGLAPPEPLSGGVADSLHLRLRYFRADREKEYIRFDSVMLLTAMNMETNQAGLYVRYPGAERFERLMMGDYRLHSLKKARHANRYLFRIENFILAPDVYVTVDKSSAQPERIFARYKKVSDIQVQQDTVLWGFSKKYFWKDADGVERKGLLFLPENYNPDKRYPVIVYFYEKNFHTEFMRREFRPSRSTISVPLYTSNDYIVFIPDITYGTGHPGQDALRAVTSGAKALIDDGFADPDRIGIQGQSWGGYQVAYIVTQTDMFRAAMAGAPVSNMTSAYGGIRWGSGLSREFQYEKAQSRIGADLWTARDLYIDNSPVFHLTDVATPLLIMHNDKDGAVPWYQGIELFMGLRRLQKPVWMLVYNDEQHNLSKMPNRFDLSKRMFQFFNHYLKDEPMPEWMKKGIPAVKKGKENGY